MLMIAIAWIYVVGLMSLTEPSIIAGIMTFSIYCVVPLSILFYISGAMRRKRTVQARKSSAEDLAATDTSATNEP